MAKPIHRIAISPLHEHWDRPKSRDKGDPKADFIYRSVGQSLTIWESVETTFAMMFGLFVESDSKAAERAYGGIISNAGRREVLENAAEIFFGRHDREYAKSDFDLLMKHFAKASGRRNEIAHGIVQSFNVNNENRGFFLVPTSYNSRKTDAKTTGWWKEVTKQTGDDPFKVFGQDYRYSCVDIDHFTQLFANLAEQSRSFFVEHFVKFHKDKFERAPDNQKSTVQLGEKKPSPHQGSE